MNVLLHNETLLKKDILFPLKWGTEEYKMYVFDSNSEMIAQVNLKTFRKPWEIVHPFSMILGNYKTVEDNGEDDKYKLVNGNFIDNNTNQIIGCVRGWGRLQNLTNPSGETRQDNIANYILWLLNNGKEDLTLIDN